MNAAPVGQGWAPAPRLPHPAIAQARARLKDREMQVLRGMALGHSNREIGQALFVAEDTVKSHARQLFRKLGARDRAHAVAIGFRSGLLPLQPDTPAAP